MADLPYEPLKAVLISVIAGAVLLAGAIAVKSSGLFILSIISFSFALIINTGLVVAVIWWYYNNTISVK